MFTDYSQKFSDIDGLDDEEVLWAGQPDPDRYLYERKLEVPKVIIFSLASIIVACFITKDLFVCIVCCCIILLVGIPAHILINRTIICPDCSYIVTNRRLLTDCPTEENEVIWQLDLEGVSTIRVIDFRDGIGTITFKSRQGYRDPIIQFVAVENPHDVVATIDRAIREVSNPSER